MDTVRTKTFQDKLADDIVDQGHAIFGGYVFKRLVNGDPTNDIDVRVDPSRMQELQKYLEETHNCRLDNSGIVDFNNAGSYSNVVIGKGGCIRKF